MAAGGTGAQPDVESLLSGVRAGDRLLLARAITLVESRSPRHRDAAEALLAALVPEAGGAVRVGITGAPGVGKSSLIEALGLHLVEAGHRLAVLAVDPSSTISGGSILGDKTRMTDLSRHPRAFIRPSPSGGSLGGVAQRTREALLLCEAAGHDVVIVETVGVGQSEVAVRSMVDFFLLLLQPSSGDELQGIKKGIVELADGLAVTKADGPQTGAAHRTRADYESALHYLAPPEDGWPVPVLACSAFTGDGLPQLWETVQSFREYGLRTGAWDRRRRAQALQWLHQLIREGLEARFYARPDLAARLPEVERDVAAGTLHPPAAARQLLGTVLRSCAFDA